MNPLKFFAQVYLLVLALIFLPVVIDIFTFWWVTDWVLGKVFPGRDFFPVGKICNAVREFFTERFI